MGEYWTLRSGGVTLLRGKNYVPDKVMTLFREADRRIDRDLLREFDQLPEGYSGSYSRFDHVVGYETSTSALIARLKLMGFDPTAVRREVIRYLRDELEGEWDEEEELIYSLSFHREWNSEFKAKIGTIEALLDGVQRWVKSTDGFPYYRGSSDPLKRFYASIWEDITEGYDDPRFMLALLTPRLRSASRVRLELTDLAFGGFLEPDQLLATTAQSRMKSEMAASGQIIVVTEGSSDAALIRSALYLIRPDVADYYSFLDFESTDAPGGVDRVVSLTRGLAAAGVMNRVVAVLDNDCAGRLAERTLLGSSLPDTFSVMRLPDVDFACDYPCLGPGGKSYQDVNGRACSVEFMFGKGVLEAAYGGELPPVRWKSFMQQLDDYQGEVLEKRRVQQALKRLLATDDPPSEIKAGAASLVQRLMDSSPAVRGPVASEMSPLLLPRVRESSEDMSPTR